MPEETVILVHGLYMNGMDMLILKKRIEQAGYHTRKFTYKSLRATPVANAVELNAFTEQVPSPVIHFVCHSLGGLVVRHMFTMYPDQKPGRVVTLGTPHHSSSAAHTLQQFSPGALLLGKSTHQGLTGDVPAWPADRELGSIAGSLRLGFGLLIPGIPKPNDGTVAVAETRLAQMKDHITLPVSHFGMLLSRSVAEQTIHFLRNGSFIH